MKPQGYVPPVRSSFYRSLFFALCVFNAEPFRRAFGILIKEPRGRADNEPLTWYAHFAPGFLASMANRPYGILPCQRN